MPTSTPFFNEKVTNFFIKWTPRAVAILVGGYYGLGIAYDLGLMAQIDQIAIQIIKHLFGYAGIGSMMPSVQWYSAWAVRIASGLVTGLVYDAAERCAQYCYSYFAPPNPARGA